MKIIACQEDYIMTGVEIIEVDGTHIRFENDRYYQMWHFFSEEEAYETFAELKEKIQYCATSKKDCLLDETIIRTRANAENIS